MTEARPFAGVDELLANADKIWWTLSNEDWLEAFRAHPKIGEKKATAGGSQQAQMWSAEEQSGAANASTDTIAELGAQNREYEDRFGFIFIICALGKSAEEMLAALNGRLQNDRKTELHLAAQEQSKITQLRLEKLLNQ